jgi:SAM-dependent methyltransferase
LAPKLGNNYVTTDFEDEFNADLKLDITNITLPDGSFDTIICYHVLEHILDDASAIRELYRILAHNGLLVVQTPFTNGELDEDLTITSPELRFKKYGQSDHVRLYNVPTLVNRLEKSGFEVDTKMFRDEQENKFGLKTTEYILLAKKL